MKVGDLVKFNPTPSTGTLGAIKYFVRVSKETKGLPGLVIKDNGRTVYVTFEKNIILIPKEYLEVVNESR